MRSLLTRLKPGGGRRPGSTGGASGGRPGKPGGASPSGSKTKAGSLLRRAARSVKTATGKASRAAASKLFGIRPSATPTGSGGSGKPKGKGKKKPGGKPGKDKTLRLGAVWTGAGKAGRLVGCGLSAIFEPFRGLRTKNPLDGLDPSTKWEVGIEGTVIDGTHVDPKLGEIAARAKKDAGKRARQLAKKRGKQAKQPEPAPEWPNVDVDEVPLPPVQGPQQWPDYDVDDYTPKTEGPPKRSLPTERDHDPPGSRPPPPRKYVPPPHREAPLVTSANTKNGGTMKSADTYVEMIDNSTPATVATTCEQAAEQARRDAAEKEEDAKKLRHQAETFDSLVGIGNKAAAQKLREEAGKCEQDARNRLQWASRLDGMARDATAKLAG